MTKMAVENPTISLQMLRWVALPFLLAALLTCDCSRAGVAVRSESHFVDKPEVLEFIDAMVLKHHLAREDLLALFRQIQVQSRILKSIGAPAGRVKPWYEYRAVFLSALRIHGGLSFWDGNAKTLSQARQVYGVPEEMVVGILGVETRYGASTGSYRVLDALATLAFDYPGRAVFFRQELESFLMLAREEKIDPLTVKGSYAGAIGIPQFMPGSYQRFAVDFDGDGRRDLLDSTADAIGSVANYFHAHGWQTGEPVAVRADVSGKAFQPVLDAGIKPRATVGELKKLGIAPRESVPDNLPAALISLEAPDGEEYWLVFNNFYVITRYNRSSKYAMAVYQLSQEISRQRKEAAGQAMLFDRPLEKVAHLLQGSTQ